MHDDAPVLTVTQAAALAGMHPQTVRQYDRLGLVVARRTAGRGRRYSLKDVEALRKVQRLAQDEGINLAGVKRILHLERHVEQLEEHLALLMSAQADHAASHQRVFATNATGDVVVVQRGRRVTRAVRGHIAPRDPRASTGEMVVWTSR